MLKSLKPLLPIIILTTILQLYYVRDGEQLFAWKFIRITDNGVYMAIFIAVRIIVLLLVSSLLTYTTIVYDVFGFCKDFFLQSFPQMQKENHFRDSLLCAGIFPHKTLFYGVPYHFIDFRQMNCRKSDAAKAAGAPCAPWTAKLAVTWPTRRWRRTSDRR